jgi:hypothetical protein
MVRFIIQRIEVDENIGMRHESYRTIDVDVPEIEEALLAGSIGPAGFEMFHLIGVEILTPNAELTECDSDDDIEDDWLKKWEDEESFVDIL